MRLPSLSLAVIVSLLLPIGAAHAATEAPANTNDDSVVDDGAVLAAVAGLLDRVEANRVAVTVSDDDAARRTSIERSLVRVIRDRRREDVVTPALVAGRLGATAQQQLEGTGGAVAAFAADHVLLGEVVSEGATPSLHLRLLVSATGAMVGTAHVAVDGTAPASTARPQDMVVAARDIADVVAEAVERTGVEVRTHRIAVPPAQATGAAQQARLDRFVASELTDALRDRGFLVVERAQLSAAMDQLALDQLTGTDDAGALGKVLGAQSLVLASVAEAGTTFVVDARVVDVERGAVLGAARATVKRDEVVGMADVETRTAGEAAIRSAIAPGWGQAYNGDGGKAVLFAIGGYGALATTAGLGLGAGLSWSAYDALAPDDKTTSAQVGARAVALREQTNTLLTATAIAGGVTVAVWVLNVVDALASGD